MVATGQLNEDEHWTVPPTKLWPPACHMPLIKRPRLAALVDRLNTLRLLCVTAPAGSGKSTLMAEWHRSLPEDGRAWLSLESSDAEPGRVCLGARHRVAAADPIPGPPAAVDGDDGGAALLQKAVDAILTHMAGHDGRVVIFLDDAHHLIGSPVETALARLAAQAPERLTLVIGTRDRLALPLSRLNLNGVAAEVTWEDLRFSCDEAAALLNEAAGSEIGLETVKALNDRAEGWATGLQLLAMALRADQHPENEMLSLSGHNVNVADYLLEDVFSRLPRSDRDFLMYTSVLDRFSAGLAAAVTGRDDTSATLERLEQANLFLLRLDDRREWFRYHHLFQEFLQARLEVEHPDLRDSLLRRASHWCAEADLLPEAMTYALRGGHTERLADLLGRAGKRMFREGDFKALQGWLSTLPHAIVEARTNLCLLAAWADAYLGEFNEARRWATVAESGLAADDLPAHAELAVIRAALGVIQTDEPETRDLSLDVVDYIPADEPALRGFGHVVVGYAHRAEGRLDDALMSFQRGVAVTDRPETALTNLLARFNIATLLSMMGRQVSAEESARASLEVATARGWDETIGAGFLTVQLGIVLREQNRLTESLDALSRGISILKASEAFGFLGVGLAERARSHWVLGNHREATADLAAAGRLAREKEVTRVGFRVGLMEARIAMSVGRLDDAEARLAQLGQQFPPLPERGGPLNEKHEVFLVEWCRLLGRRDRLADLVRVAGIGVASALATGRIRNAVAFLALQAAAWKGLDQPAKVRDKLVRALDLVRGQACVRAFLAPGPILHDDLADVAAEGGAHSVTILPILAATEGTVNAGDGVPSLHYREIQIVGLLAYGLRNREIAERLKISEETVKWYLKQLYQKLEVRSRVEAVQRARELNLIS